MAQSDKTQAAKEQFSRIANDLMNIEVNIILKEEIPVQKMPDPRHALIDIGKMYWKELRTLSYLAEPCLDPNVPDIEVSEWETNQWFGSFAAFDAIRNWADEILDCIDQRGEQLSTQVKTDLSILSRIKDNSDQIKGIYTSLILRDKNLEEFLIQSNIKLERHEIKNPNEVVDKIPAEYERKHYLTNCFSRAQLVMALSQKAKYPPLDLTPDELVLLRKIWEIGVEVVAMQTVIQVDGDVMTRIHPNYLSDHYKVLHDYHNEGVGISLRYWKDLVNVAKDLVIAVTQGITGRLRGDSS